MRVPVTVKNDHSVGRLEVQAKPPGPGAEEEDEVLRAGLIEGLQQHAPVLCFCGSWWAKENGVSRVGWWAGWRDSSRETQRNTCLRAQGRQLHVPRGHLRQAYT